MNSIANHFFLLSVAAALLLIGNGTQSKAQDRAANSSAEFPMELVDDLTGVSVTPTRSGVKDYFATYRPDASNTTKVKQLIKELGSDDFKIRSQATMELATVSHTDIPLIREATESNDLEISLRARQVLKMFEKGTHLKRLQKVLAVMERHQLSGFAPDLCTAMNVVQPAGSLLRQFQKTLVTTSQPSDLGYLQKRLSDPNQFARQFVVEAMGNVKNENQSDLFAKLARDDQSESVRLAAARQLSLRLDRRCLKPLIDLLSSESISIRSLANSTLRNITGQKFKFFASADDDQRIAAIKKWDEWYSEKGAEATLFAHSTRTVEYVNRLIVSSYSSGKIYETDMDGKVLRTITIVGSPMGVFGSEDGKILVCDYRGKKIRVFDANSKEVFAKTLPGAPLAGEFLENGNILVGTTNAKQVLELDSEGKVVWKATVTGRINVVHRTFEGTTLVSMLGEGKVIELDESGKIIFELEVTKPNGVRRLENGNTLVCAYGTGEVHEYDSDKNIVWKATGLQSPARAQRMPDGNTIVYHRGGIVIFDETGKKVRDVNSNSFKSGGVGSIHYF